MLPITLFHDRTGPTPDPSWQQALDRIAPRTAFGHDWLLLRWEPGDAWDPLERWFIWQMTPEHRVPFGLLDQLRGPNPRNFGHYDAVKQRFVSAKAFMINQEQWRLYRETGCYGRPLWVIQGGNAGHLRRFSDVQSAVAEMHGESPDPPIPGELPYANFDNRVIDKLRYMDVVQKYGDILRIYGNGSNDLALQQLDKRERAQVADMAHQLWNWLGTQTSQMFNPGDGDSFTRAQIDELWNHADESAPEPDYEQIEQDFMETVDTAY